jgi:uncharacterized membrane protein
MVISASILVLLAQMAKYMALQNHQASKLQIIFYLSLPLQFIVDSTFFGLSFTMQQFIGLILFICLYIAIVFRHCFPTQETDDNFKQQIN